MLDCDQGNMQISQQDALKRLASTDNLARLNPTFTVSDSNVEVITKQTPKRGTQIPEPVRDLIGSLSHSHSSDGSKLIKQTDLAEIFGVSNSAVSASKTGRVGGKPANDERHAKHAANVEAAKDTALNKLMGALGVITEEKLEDLSAKDASQVASNMGKVYNSLTPKDNPDAGNRINLIFYSPEIKTEEKYKVVDA